MSRHPRTLRIVRTALLGATGYFALSVTPFVTLSTNCNSAGSGCAFAAGQMCLDGEEVIDNYRTKVIITD
ncbi:MAG: hypothetical protein ACRELC_08035 [Gemmatimonadota bacterium]